MAATATQTPVRSYTLGPRSKKLYTSAKKEFGTNTFTKTDLVEIGLKQKGNDEGYIDYMISGMRKKGFLRQTKGKFTIGDGTVAESVIKRRKANA